MFGFREKREMEYEKSAKEQRELVAVQQQRDRMVKDNKGSSGQLQLQSQSQPQPQQQQQQYVFNERDQERERQEKLRAAEQAVHKHFEESLRLAHQKVITIY